MSHYCQAGTFVTSWLAPILDCLCVSPRKDEPRRHSRRIGVEREMRICHHQPHLVPPMKLVVYEDMPSTPQFPPPSQISQLVSQGRNLASRASERASLSTRKRQSSRPKISAPRLRTADELPLGRMQQYRPLELSIYLPDNRLSDLPAFDVADFNDFGEIQLPPRALIHSRSEEHLGFPSSSSLSRKPATSMVGERQLGYWQRSRSSSVISTSRPPSAHDAFHSHPVAFNTLPGLAPPSHSRHTTQGNGLTVLSPMQEEFTPPPEAYVDTLEFPDVEGEQNALPIMQVPPELTPPKPAVLEHVPTNTSASFKLNRPPTSHSYRSRSYSQNNSFNRTRVSQWISRSASATSTSSSPATHESRRAQFYQCAATSPPQTSNHSRQRTMSASTVATSILSDEGSVASLTSMTTAPTTVQDLRSRSNTIKSYGKPVVIVQEELPPSYADAGAVALHGVETVKVPGIGVAF